MRVQNLVRALGGHARWGDLHDHLPRSIINDAIASGEIIRTSRGMYSLPQADARAKAKRLQGVVSHYTAAYMHNMGAVIDRREIDITVGRHRHHVPAAENVRLHYIDIPPEDIGEHVTTPLRTAIDCARTYPFAEALTVVETGVLTRRLDKDELEDAVWCLRGYRCAMARRVVRSIDLRAQSPMESYLRGLLLDADITCFVPQFEVIVDGEKLGTADLGDESTKVLLEADSFAWHGSRVALADDAHRYNQFVANGYVVLRFAWEHLWYSPAQLVETVRKTLAWRRPT